MGYCSGINSEKIRITSDLKANLGQIYTVYPVQVGVPSPCCLNAALILAFSLNRVYVIGTFLGDPACDKLLQSILWIAMQAM